VGVDRWILGSVAERVVRMETVPVLTVHVDRVHPRPVGPLSASPADIGQKLFI
jgi:hypothetical protein